MCAEKVVGEISAASPNGEDYPGHASVLFSYRLKEKRMLAYTLPSMFEQMFTDLTYD